MKIKWWHIVIFVVVILIVAAILRPGRMRTGWMHQMSGRPDVAVAKFTELYEKDPNNHRVIFNLAQALEAASRELEAEEHYLKLIAIKPRGQYFKELVRFYSWTEQPRKAMKAYDRWYEFRKEREETFDNKEGLSILNNLYAYDLLYKNFDQGIEVLKALRPLDKKNTTRIDNDLLTLYERTGNLDATIAYLEKILAKDSFNKYALEKFIQLAKISGREAEVERILMSNIEKKPGDADNWKRLITFEARMDNLATANEWYVKWLDYNPHDKDLRKQYIAWLLATNQLQEAKRYIASLDREDRTDPYLNQTLYQLYTWTDDKQQLFNIYLQRFRHNPRNRRNAKDLLDLTFDLKRYGVGKEVLEKLITIYPDNAEYAIMLSDLYDLEKKPNRSIAVLEKAAKGSDNPKLLKSLGEHYLWSADAIAPEETITPVVPPEKVE